MKPWYSDVLKKDDPALRAEMVRALMEQREIKRNRVEEHAGRIIEFRRGKGHLCGVLRPRKGQAGWKVLDQEGRERSVRGAKVINISAERIDVDQRDEIVRVLRAINRRREAVELRRVDGETPARLICKELTVLASATVAAFCAEKGIPAI